MSSSQSTIDLIASLNNLGNTLNRYVPIFIYIFGIFGNFLNVLVLGQRHLRSNSSAFCFLVSSIASLLAIVSGLTSRMMSGYAVDLTLTVDWICQIRNFILYFCRTVALWMIALAAWDRWLSSHANERYRNWSKWKNTLRMTMIILSYAFVIHTPYSFCYKANLTGALRGCYGATYACRVVTDLIYAIGSTAIPIILMIIFGIGTIRNIRHSRIRVGAVTESLQQHTQTVGAVTNLPRQQRRQTKKKERHLLKMLIIQIILLFFLACPHPIEKAYISISVGPPAQSLDGTIQNFVFNILTLLTFTSSGMPFYIYTLTGGSLFRAAFFNLLRPMGRKLCPCQCISSPNN